MGKFNLNQDKLDVVLKTRSNVFDWRGQFTPELIEYLLSEFAQSGYVIADPFSGSGTVLLEATKLGYDCYGFEINPSAHSMSKFYEYSNLDKAGRDSLVNEIRKLFGVLVRDMDAAKMVYTNNTDYRKAYENLLAFATYCKTVTPSHLLPFVLNVLFLCEKDKKLSLRDSLIKNINTLKTKLYELPYANNKIQANWADARSINTTCQGNVDLMITSPPYINVFNYHQNYRGIVECFDYNLLQVANSEIGSNRKNRQNRFKTVIQYAIDMGHVLHSCMLALKEGGRMIWVVGRTSNVRKVAFYNSAIVKDLVESIEGLKLEDSCFRSFGNRYGEKIIEDILIIKKVSSNNNQPDVEKFESIGIDHLEAALPNVADEDKPDIEILTNKYNRAYESPILIAI